MVLIINNAGLQVHKIKTHKQRNDGSWWSPTCQSCGRGFSSKQIRFKWRLMLRGHTDMWWRTDCPNCIQLMLKDMDFSIKYFLKALLE